MSPKRFLVTALLAFCVSLPAFSQEESAPLLVSGPEELRRHIDPAKELADRFLGLYDRGHFTSAENLMWKKSAVVSRTAEFYDRKFGKFESRELLRAVVSETYPPEADATFVIFHYTARFAKKKAHPQKVVVRMNENGTYQIAVFP